jgi:outer membrane biosynthesis protein TonB
VERVVQSHRAFVKRQCWEAALAARPPKAPPSVKVAVSITVGSDGRVQSTSASGGEAYPGLNSCVQSQVRGWTFPRSDGATVNVPFIFAAQ